MNIADFKEKYNKLIEQATDRVAYNDRRGGIGVTTDGELLRNLLKALDAEN
ncbi:TPA: hypothetical protein ACGO4G_000156 [Streptococcus suis]